MIRWNRSSSGPTPTLKPVPAAELRKTERFLDAMCSQDQGYGYTDSATPSIAPSAVALAPSTVVRKTGSSG